MSQEKDPEFEEDVNNMPNEEEEENNGLSVYGGNEETDDDLELVTDRIKDNLLEEDMM